MKKLPLKCRECISNFIPHFIMDVFTYPCCDLCKSMSVKMSPLILSRWIVGAKPFLNQCLTIINGNPWNKLQWDLKQNTKHFSLALPWRHNGLDSVSNHQPHHCLLSRLFGRRSKKTSKLRVTGLCAWNSPGTGEFPAQRASYAENVSIWWRHHGKCMWKCHLQIFNQFVETLMCGHGGIC